MGLPALYKLNCIFDKALHGSQFTTYSGAKIALFFEKEVQRIKYIQPDAFPNSKRDVIIHGQVESLPISAPFEMLFKPVGKNLVGLTVVEHD